MGYIGSSSYRATHLWMEYHSGKASKCENCVYPAKKYEWSNTSGEYKRERDDWQELCTSCHRLKDKGNKCIRGHEFTPVNTMVRKRNPRARICRKCDLIRHKK